VGERNYDNVTVAADGALFYLQRPQSGAVHDGADPEAPVVADLWRFDFEERKPKLLRGEVTDYSLSGDRKKLLIAAP
ncbi:hypothetical protein ABTK93_21455, partial [Acinetobacter baumannii]